MRDASHQALYTSLFEEKSQLVALGLSAGLPGAGQFYNDEPVKGSIIAVTEVALLAAAVTFHVLGAGAEEEYNENTSETVDRRQDAMDHYELRNVMLYSAVAVYALQLVDAALNSPEPPSVETRFESMGSALGFRW